MTYETLLYRGWWVYGALIGLGLTLILLSYKGTGLWLSLLLLVGMAIAALYASLKNWTPSRRLSLVLSEKGITFLGHPQPPDGQNKDFFVAWAQINGVRILPRPGYWQTSILTSLQPDVWIFAGHTLDLAENIAEIAGIPYDEHRKQEARMGSEHYWLISG